MTSALCPATFWLPVVSAGLSLLLPPLTFVQCMTGLVSEHRRRTSGLEALEDG